jgi:U3 small nucleolar RNA-associated protein 16
MALPSLLPAEFLTDSSSEDEDDEDTSAAALARPKRRKVDGVENRLSRFDRAPKDKAAGSTIYRVAKKVDERLAPKLRKTSRHSRQTLLKRERVVAKPGKSFLRKTRA